MLKFCVEIFHNLEKSMSYAFSISHVRELNGQNRCASGTWNIESNTHGLREIKVIAELGPDESLFHSLWTVHYRLSYSLWWAESSRDITYNTHSSIQVRTNYIWRHGPLEFRALLHQFYATNNWRDLNELCDMDLLVTLGMRGLMSRPVDVERWIILREWLIQKHVGAEHMYVFTLGELDCHHPPFRWITNDCRGTAFIMLHRRWRHETKTAYWT
jgi:hypothetical protein